jgi:hypothetical protein
MGFNSFRLPWSNEMVEKNPAVADSALAANLALTGKHALEIFDAVIDAIARQGLLVTIDNHVSCIDWCCVANDGEGLWYKDAYPESSWLADWRMMRSDTETSPPSSVPSFGTSSVPRTVRSLRGRGTAIRSSTGTLPRSAEGTPSFRETKGRELGLHPRPGQTVYGADLGQRIRHVQQGRQLHQRDDRPRPLDAVGKQYLMKGEVGPIGPQRHAIDGHRPNARRPRLLRRRRRDVDEARAPRIELKELARATPHP